MGAAAWKGKVDFGIITIREDEYIAVLKRFPEQIEVVSGHHRRYRLRRLKLSPTQTYTVAILRCIEAGNGEAQDAARDLLEEIAPGWIFVVGIAGGVPAHEFSLGDVIVSSRIADFSVEAVLKDQSREYALGGGPLHADAAKLVGDVSGMVHDGELGNWNDAPTIGLRRPSVEIADESFYGDDAWQKDVREKLERHFDDKAPRPPIVTTGAIASSDRLIKDAETLGVWLKIARQIQAVEMESSGIYRATRGKVPFLAIRGISDVVGFKRHPDWTEYACHTAAAFLVAFLRAIPPQGGKLRWDGTEVMAEAAPIAINAEPQPGDLELWPQSRAILLALSANRVDLGRVLQNQFANSTSQGLSTLRALADVASDIHEADVPVVIGVVGEAVRSAWLSNAESDCAAATICALLGSLPPEERGPRMIGLMPLVASGKVVAALILSHLNNELSAEAYSELVAAAAQRISRDSAHPWGLLCERQLPRIIAVWAKVDEPAAIEWAAARLDEPNWSQGVKFLHTYLLPGGTELQLDGERLGKLVTPDRVDAFLRLHAHSDDLMLVEVKLAFRRAMETGTWNAATPDGR